jgi:hypothetical protein
MMQLVLIVAPQKERSTIVNRSGTVANALSTNISMILTELVYLQKTDQTSPSWAFH